MHTYSCTSMYAVCIQLQRSGSTGVLCVEAPFLGEFQTGLCVGKGDVVTLTVNWVNSWTPILLSSVNSCMCLLLVTTSVSGGSVGGPEGVEEMVSKGTHVLVYTWGIIVVPYTLLPRYRYPMGLSINLVWPYPLPTFLICTDRVYTPGYGLIDRGGRV